MKQHYAPFGIGSLLALVFAITLALHGQSINVPQQQDKLSRNIIPNATVTWSPADVGVKNASIATATTLTGLPVNVADSHTVLVAFNCNQAIATVSLQPVFEDGTTGTAIPVATASTASQWDYVWLSDTMTESAVGATAGTARLPLGQQIQLSFNNTSGSTATCNARVIVQY